ncbi:MAG: polysaccharide pyruvyl transferase family protein [Opitutus sp.]
MPKLSVVIPTLNCIGMLPAHLKTMRSWLGLVDEIVVVDSFSTDGTPEYLKKNLRHDNVKVVSHPRGLYQSWNYGISQTTGDWVYISTVGDGITKTLLQHLCDVGERLQCDVVASRPTFTTADDRPANRQIWPIDHILKTSSSRQPVRLGGPETFLFALYNIPCAVLGSSASNIYRGNHLRVRPFPTEFGTVGDTAWTLLHGLTTRYAFTPEVGSFFRLHPKAYSASEYAVNNLLLKMAEYALQTTKDPAQGQEVQEAVARCQLVETASLMVQKLRAKSAAIPATAYTPISAVKSGTGSLPEKTPEALVSQAGIGRESSSGPLRVIRPGTLNLQAIDICNSRCVMCNIWKDGKREKMTVPQLRAFLAQPFFSEVGHVGVTGGEPTLRTDLIDLYRLLPEVLPKLAGASFITHGMQTARAIGFYAEIHRHYRARNLGFEGMVSLDGVGLVHDQVRGRKGAFESASQTLLGLKKLGVPVIAACTIVRSNVYGLHDLLEWGKSHDVYVRFRVAEFIRRLYNEPCASQIRSFDDRELRHVVSFFHVLLTDYEKDAAIRKTYESILSILTGGERRIGCPYRKGVAVNIDSQGGVASCAPKGKAFVIPAELGELHDTLQQQRDEVASQHCASCIHDYHEDWTDTARTEVIQAAQRGRDLYEVADGQLTASEVPAVNLDLKVVKKVLLAGWYGTETIGDIAILQGIITEYLRVNPALEFWVLSLFPYYTRTTIAVWPAELRARIQIADYVSEAGWQASNECDVLVMAGGPLMDIGETQKILCLFKRFADLGKPRVIEGCGVGPLNQAQYRWNVCRTARLATQISVRDRASKEMLRSFGIQKAITVRPDPATTFIRDQNIHHHGSDRGVVRCFLRELTSEYPQSITPRQAEQKLGQLLQNLLEWYPEHRVELWAMHHFPVGYDDRLFAQRLVKQVASARLSMIWEPRTPREILEAMAAAEFCVCMRFHSCVFAAEVGAPFLAIDYTAGGKIRGFLEDVRQVPRLCLLADTSNLDHAEFKSKVWPAVRCDSSADVAADKKSVERSPLILHVIQRVTGGGGARAMISLAKYSAQQGGPQHRLISLLEPDATGRELATEAGLSIVDRPSSTELDLEIARADVVLAHWWNVPEMAELFSRDFPASRLVVWLHVGGYHAPQLLTKPLIHFADLAVACSPHTYAHPAFEGVESSRKAMVLAGADFARLASLTKSPHDGFRVGYIGTVDPVKMHGDFIAMSSAVRVPDIKFVVCGGGDDSWLTAKAAQLGRSSSFEFQGSVENIADVLKRLDVYGYPLCADTYAAAELNLQEAMFAGLPVVTFPHGGIGRLIQHGETGLLVNSPEEYTAAIESLYHSPEERKRLGSNAAEFARRHWGAENAARDFNVLLQQLLLRPKTDRRLRESPGVLVPQNPLIDRELAIHRGTRLFLESIADAATLFLESIKSIDCDSAVRADQRIAELPRMMHYTGILAYRNAFPKDPYLQMWAALGFLKVNDWKSAGGAFQAAALHGLSHCRIGWYLALTAEHAGATREALVHLNGLRRAAPQFAPAIAMERRLSALHPAPKQTGQTAADVAMRHIQQAQALLQHGQNVKAREHLQSAMDILPAQVAIMEIACDLDCRLGRLQSARALYDAILNREPGRVTPRLAAIRQALSVDAVSGSESRGRVASGAVLQDSAIG